MMKNNKGFTLVELIIVVAIIAVLATVLAPSYLQYVERSRESNDLQLATNIMDSAVLAAANPQNDVPANQFFVVFWSTDTLSETAAFHDHLCVLFTAPPVRESIISERGDVAVSNRDAIEAFAKDMFTSLGIAESDITEVTSAGEVSGWWAKLPEAQSNIALSSKFYFHVNTSTGEIALAGNGAAGVGSVNLWLDLGVNAIAAP